MEMRRREAVKIGRILSFSWRPAVCRDKSPVYPLIEFFCVGLGRQGRQGVLDGRGSAGSNGVTPDLMELRKYIVGLG